MATVLAMGALTPFASPVLLSRLLERPEAAREEVGHFAPEKGSCQEWVGSILAYIGVFAGSAMVCFVAAPNLLNFVTRGIHGGGEGRNH